MKQKIYSLKSSTGLIKKKKIRENTNYQYGVWKKSCHYTPYKYQKNNKKIFWTVLWKNRQFR